MSLAQDYLDRGLKLDVEGYLKRIASTGLALARRRRAAVQSWQLDQGIGTMAIEEKDAKVQLKSDFECYLRGEEPSSQQLIHAPLLKNWRVVTIQFGVALDSLCMVLWGSVVNHPLLDDHKSIHTSQLIWLDRNRKWARTWNRIYRLGDPVGNNTEDGGVGL